MLKAILKWLKRLWSALDPLFYFFGVVCAIIVTLVFGIIFYIIWILGSYEEVYYFYAFLLTLSYFLLWIIAIFTEGIGSKFIIFIKKIWDILKLILKDFHIFLLLPFLFFWIIGGGLRFYWKTIIKYNPFHLVTPRPWPFFTSLSFFSFALGVIVIIHTFDTYPFLLSLVGLCISSYIWGLDIHREGRYLGDHNLEVMDGFKIGIIVFILSECFFFLGIFWAYFHLAESPNLELGSIWPPLGVVPFNPRGVPFINTILLVSSGVSATWAHHAIEVRIFKTRVISLFITIFLGISFSILQLLEYYVAGFTFSCSSYSSVYFIGTGFHGLHVLIGSCLLLLCLFRFSILSISSNHRVGFECSVWYWHFVDVVWFCLYFFFYWWGA